MTRKLQTLVILFFAVLAVSAMGQDDNEIVAGPIFSKFDLTLSTGIRTEAAGPLYYSQQIEAQQQRAFPPLGCYTRTTDVDWTEMEILYPIMSYRRFGGEYRLQFFEFFAFYGGKSTPETGFRQFTLFPFYFQQRSPDTNLNYTAVMPFYGEYRNRLFRDDTKFIMFPIYAETRKRDVVTDNYLFPIFDVRRGNHLTGWQVWPVVGVEHKTPTLYTNLLDETEVVGGWNKYFAAWPFYSKATTGLGTTNVEATMTVVPFYSHTKSSDREETCYGWPMGYDVTEDRARKYSERDFFWPLFVFAHGSKNVTRIFPFYSKAEKTSVNIDSLLGEGSLLDMIDPAATVKTVDPSAGKSSFEDDFYLWPVYKFNRLDTASVERRRTRILFFLYSNTTETNLESGTRFRRADFWPFYTYRREYNGNQRLQILAFLEPFFPNNRSIAREYSQTWSIWRNEKNPKTGASSESLLWNLYRREVKPQSKNYSLFFGLYQYESGVEGRRWRVCYLPAKKETARASPPKT